MKHTDQDCTGLHNTVPQACEPRPFFNMRPALPNMHLDCPPPLPGLTLNPAAAAAAAALPRYADGRFDLDNAKGPFRLDLGDVLYAPNVMRDDQGRVVLWGWLQEKRTVRGAACLQCTRIIFISTHDRCARTNIAPMSTYSGYAQA